MIADRERQTIGSWQGQPIPADQGKREAIVAADGTSKPASDAATRLDATERRLVASMPLHAITSVHGEVGLRERLLIEIA